MNRLPVAAEDVTFPPAVRMISARVSLGLYAQWVSFQTPPP